MEIFHNQAFLKKLNEDKVNRAVFKMTVESNYVIAIAKLSDWLKRLAPVFQPMRSKSKTNRNMYA